MELVVGADVGGTSTRVAVADLTGRVLSLARGGPGNPTSVGFDGSTEQVRTVAEEALAELDGDVVATVVGLAGITGAPGVQEDYLRRALPPRAQVAPLLISDLAVAYAAGTPERRGYVVIAGTGSAAGALDGPELIERRDGWGWLLGDSGSGFWLGREAVRMTLATFQANQEPGPLAQAVIEATGARTHSDLVSHCYAHPPTKLAALATLVPQTFDLDPISRDIAERAVTLLCDELATLHPLAKAQIVLGGSVLTAPGPIGEIMITRLSGLGYPAVRSGPGVVGALWIALNQVAKPAVEVHTSLLESSAHWH